MASRYLPGRLAALFIPHRPIQNKTRRPWSSFFASTALAKAVG
jgi:hypothetical protein